MIDDSLRHKIILFSLVEISPKGETRIENDRFESKFNFNSRFFLDIQQAAGVMEGTIRTIYRIMLAKAADIFPADSPHRANIQNLPSS